MLIAAPGIVGIFALAACAHMQETNLTHPTVTVVVQSIGAEQPSGYTCVRRDRFRICVSEDPIVLQGDANTENTITWSLVSDQWNFTRHKGIDIPRSQWRITEGDKVYTATKKKDGRAYKYEINVTNGTTTLNWDPTIMN